MNLLVQLQQAIANRIAAADWFRTPKTIEPVLETFDGPYATTVLNRVQRQVNELGLSVYVRVPTVELGEYPDLRTVVITMHVAERPVTNQSCGGTRKSAHDAALEIDCILSEQSVLEPFAALHFRSLDLESDQPLLAFQISYQTHIRVIKQES